MMNERSPQPSRRAGAVELLERVRGCSAAAFDALRAGDDDDVLRLLGERERLMLKAEPLLGPLGSRGSGASAEVRRAVVEALRGVQAADARLGSALRTRRDETGTELDEISHSERGSAGYGQNAPPAPGRRLNLVR